MKIGVITVLFNSEKVLPDFLDSLRSQTLHSFKLFAVDNASYDRSLTILDAVSEFPIQIIKNPDNLGYAEGANLGINEAIKDKCDALLIINNDTTFPPNLLQEFASSSAPGVIVVPKIYIYGSKRIWFAGGYFSWPAGGSLKHIGEGTLDDGQFDRPAYITCSTGCCMFLSADVISTVGLFDKKYFAYWEDTDFFLRLRRQGFKILYQPTAIINHKVSSLTGGARSDFGTRMGARNRVYFLKKHYGSLVAISIGLLYAIVAVANVLSRRDSRRRFAIKLKALYEGFRL